MINNIQAFWEHPHAGLWSVMMLCLMGIFVLTAAFVTLPPWNKITRKIKSLTRNKEFIFGYTKALWFILIIMLIVFISIVFGTPICNLNTSALFCDWLGANNKRETLLIIAFGMIVILLLLTSNMLINYIKKYPMHILIAILIVMTGYLLFIGLWIKSDMTTLWILGTKSKKGALEFIAFGMGGVVAAIVAASINRRSDVQEQNNKLIAQGHDNERFENMITNLGHDKVAVRIATFYRFYYLVEKNKDDSSQKLKEDIFEILCSYLRAMSDEASDLAESDKASDLAEKNKKEHSNERQTLFDILFKDKFKSNNNGLMSDNFPADLQRINLDKMDLSNSNLSHVNLSHANLLYTDFSHANLLYANFFHADLSHANFSSADFSHANLVYAVFLNTYFSDTNFSGAELLGAVFSNNRLLRVNFSNANLKGAEIMNTDLSDANLSNANLFYANLSRANLSDANLSRANLSNTNLSNANLLDANLSDANLSDANLSDANLSNANLSDANLSDANLSDANLFYANLSDANLFYANLSDANL